ncbi:MAG TPA: hypothetical protein VF219_14170 [Vicinamibacterales bacterium]
MIGRNELAIVQAVVYASIFDYPLTLAQLRATLVGATMSTEQVLATYESSARLRAIVDYRDGFFVLAGRNDLIRERRRRERHSRRFLQHHARLLRWICAIPFTRMVALSGSIAHLNMDEDGDLDLFIVARGHHVWSVTVAVVLLTKVLRARRVVCANFVISDTNLVVEQQDLFTANQILHLRPLIGREVLDGFLAANPFVRRFYPNPPIATTDGVLNAFNPDIGPGRRRLKASLEFALAAVSPLMESMCRRAYTWHLRRRSVAWTSPEQVRLQPDYLKLHTKSHRRSVLERFDEEVEVAVGRGERAAIA